MQLSFTFLVLVSALVGSIEGLPQLYRGEEVGVSSNRAVGGPRDDDLYLTQRLDHFNRNLQDTFQQVSNVAPFNRYFFVSR